MLRLVVCVKLAVDVALVRARPDGTPDIDVPWRINPFDEHGLELAATLAEQHDARVIALVLTVAAPPHELLLRLLAAGADEVVLISDAASTSTDALAKADLLAAAITRLEADLIICGEASADYYDAQIGARLAAALDLPCAAWCTRVTLSGRTLTADRALEDTVETVAFELPGVVTVGQELGEPRLPSVLQILGAGRKPIATWSGEGFTVPARRQVVTRGTVAPPGTRRHHRFDVRKDETTVVVDALVAALARDGALEVRQ